MTLAELVTTAEPMQPPVIKDLFAFLGRNLAVLWEEWPKSMDCASFDPRSGEFALAGECPHCRKEAAFLPATNTWHEEDRVKGDKWVSALKCVACRKYILGIIGWVNEFGGTKRLQCLEYYPVGTPDDDVSVSIPPHIRQDFQEALRCRWVKAFKATVLMCRRSLQASCDEEEAQGKDLFVQIDDLLARGVITGTLQKMAHRIRLLGKKGAHGDFSDIDDSITVTDADEAIIFMDNYLRYVYTLPAQLDP